MMKITEALLAEHQVFHSLFDHLEKHAASFKTVAEIRTVALLLEAMLAAHARTEDRLFIDPLEHCLEQIGQRDTFHEEHEEIDAQLLGISKTHQVKQARALLLAAVLASRKHFDKEERLIFPLAERVMSAATLVTLGKKWAEQRVDGG
jgi:hemerythrin-like domain-containing protein